MMLMISVYFGLCLRGTIGIPVKPLTDIGPLHYRLGIQAQSVPAIGLCFKRLAMCYLTHIYRRVSVYEFFDRLGTRLL